MKGQFHSSTLNLMFLPHPIGILTTIYLSSEPELGVSKKETEGKETNEEPPDRVLFPSRTSD